MLNDLIEGLLGCQTLDGIEHERPVDGLIADRERPHSRGERLERLFGRQLHQQPLFVRAGLRVLDRSTLKVPSATSCSKSMWSWINECAITLRARRTNLSKRSHAFYAAGGEGDVASLQAIGSYRHSVRTNGAQRANGMTFVAAGGCGACTPAVGRSRNEESRSSHVTSRPGARLPSAGRNELARTEATVSRPVRVRCCTKARRRGDAAPRRHEVPACTACTLVLAGWPGGTVLISCSILFGEVQGAVWNRQMRRSLLPAGRSVDDTAEGIQGK